MQFYALTEENDHEGETWVWFFRADPTEFKKLDEAVSKLDEFSLSPLSWTQEEIESAIEILRDTKVNTGYCNTLNLLSPEGFLVMWEAPPEEQGGYYEDCDNTAENLYKGGIRDFIMVR